MRLRRWTCRLLTATLGVVAAASSAAAQIDVDGLRLEGGLEAGARFFLEEPSRTREANFLEYRDINEGPYLQGLDLRLFRPDESYSVALSGRQWGLQDQEYSLSAGRLGLWQLEFDWDQMRHVISSDSRMLATETARGVFTLPTPRPPLATYNGGRRVDEIGVRWDTAHLVLRLSPTPELDLVAEYTRIHKDGDRPLGVAFGSPGNNFLEVLQPIDQTIHEFRLRGTLARERWQLQFAYGLSIFQNDRSRVLADNPCFANAAACGGNDGGAAAPAAGQVSLPPDNMAHTLSLQGGVNLPLRTRLTGNVAYSLRLQNDAFLPHTVNPALAGNPDLVLPQRSLNGNQQVFLVNVNATSRPLPLPVVFTGKYRLYDLMDLSDTITFPGLVQDDRTVETARRAPHYDYQRQNADLDARWRLGEWAALTAGVGWERWDRNRLREVPVSDEFSGKGALDLTPLDWLSVRATYRPSFRRIERYNTRTPEANTVVEDPAAASMGQSVLLRKYDESDRDRQRAELLVQIMPTETLTLTPTVTYTADDYVHSVLGLQRATTWSAGADVSWTPAPRLSLAAGYTRESTFQKQRSRSRPVVGGAGLDFADYDWISDSTDTVDTVYAGVKVALIATRLDWSSNLSFSTATGRIETRNPVAPASGSAGNNATASAKPMPAFEDNLWRLETALRYHISKSWTASLLYVFESFTKHDWRTDTLDPFIGISSIYLGNDQRNYTAHIIGATLRYDFK